MSASINRKELAAILEEYGGSLAIFDQQREDSYLKSIAGQSLERLEQCLRELFYPGQTAAEARLKCPPWPPGTEREGRLPDASTLNRIIEQFNTEQCLGGLEPIEAFLKQFSTAIKGTSLSNNDALTNSILALAGQELIKAKQAGTPISAQIDVVDRLQSQQMITAKQAELKLKRDRFEFDAAKACLKVLPTLRQIAADSSLNENSKINAIREALFGEVPE